MTKILRDKILNLILVLCICLGCVGCAHLVSSRELTPNENSLVESANSFGFKLFQEIAGEEGDKNIFLSPLSISMALEMLYNGAGGTTREAMQTTLGLSGLATQEINESYQSLIELWTGLDQKTKFEIANSIWLRQGYQIEPEFIDSSRTYFDAEIGEIDIRNLSAASEAINAWVKRNTHGKIKRIGVLFGPDTMYVVVNATYFEGTWTYRFEEKRTKDDWFILPDGSKKECKMMHLRGKLQYLHNSNFQAVNLPYGNGYFSMTIFLPNSDKDIDSLIAEFNQENWSQWINSFTETEGRMILEFPKFTLEYEVKLNEALKALGMEVAFDLEAADFSGIVKNPIPPLAIEEVKHKTFVEVNEKGTKAAAVTHAVNPPGPPLPVMRVDRPFVFVIQESHSQTILFIGKIVNPAP